MTTTRLTVDLAVLGPVSALIDDRPVHLTSSERRLLALLVAAGPPGLSLDLLATEFWDDRPPRSWGASLRNLISKLNKKFPQPIVRTAGGFRQLNLSVVNRVDAWQLDGNSLVAPADIDPSLLMGSPYLGVEPSLSIRISTDLIESRRRAILERWEHDDVALPPTLLSVVRSIVERQPYDQMSARLAVLLHLRSGEHQGAKRVVEMVTEELDEKADWGGDVVHELGDLVDQASVAPLDRVEPTTIRSPALAVLAESEMFGRRETVVELIGLLQKETTSTLLIEGEAAVGKTRVAAEIAVQLADVGWHTAYLRTHRTTSASLQPFVEAFAGLRSVVDPWLSTKLDDPTDRARCWLAVLGFLEERYRSRPMLLVADEVNWLDPLSSALLAFLARSETENGLKLVVIGRVPVASEPGWVGLMQAISGPGLIRRSIPPLTSDAIRQLIEARHRLPSSVLLAAATDELERLSHGLPAVAVTLIDRLDPATGRLVDEHSSFASRDPLVNSLDTTQRQLAASAAVLGLDFNLTDAALLAELTAEVAQVAADRLVDAGLVTDTSRPDEYRFSHMMAREAVLAGVTDGRLARLHRRAVDLSDDPHQKSEHAVRAIPLIEVPVAVQIVKRSAHLHYAHANYPGVVRALEEVEQLDPSALEPDELMLVESVERTGLRAGERRRSIVERELAAGRPGAALGAAIAGLPETEDPSGDPERVAVISQIDRALLEPADQVIHDVQLSRQRLLTGDTTGALELARRALGSTTDPELKTAAWLALRHANGWLPDPGDDPDWIDERTSPRLRARVHEAQALAGLATGLTQAVDQSIRALQVEAREAMDPLAQWHGLLLGATAATDRGDLNEAMTRSEEAQELGLRFGLRSSVMAADAQRLSWAWMGDDLDSIVASLSGAAADAAGNPLFEAATATFGFLANPDPQTRETVIRLVEEAPSSRFGAAVAAILSLAVPLTGDADAIERTRSHLEPFRACNILVGAGLCNLGPCRPILARLTDDISAKGALLRDAVEDSDRTVGQLWRVKTRLELARVVDTEQATALRQEARSLATTNWLRTIIAREEERVA